MIFDNSQVARSAINETQNSPNDLVFSSSRFNYFNKDKCEFIYTHYDNKMSMIFGVRNSCLLAPFSAPFSFIRYGSKYIKYSHVHDFFKSLKENFFASNLDSLKISLPPYFYDESLISKISHCFNDLGFQLSYRDVNSHINLDAIKLDLMPSVTKKAIRTAAKYNNEMVLCNSEEQKLRAYKIIKENRDMNGYPLRMSWEEIFLTTSNVAKAFYFYTTIDGHDAAAAIVFEVNREVVQVIYWGANEIGEKSNSMYFLPFELVKFFKDKGYKHMDIGPSSENGKLSIGLNDYKQMIGCSNSLKETWVLNK